MALRLKLFSLFIVIITATVSAETNKIMVRGEIFDRLTTKSLPGVKLSVINSHGESVVDTLAYLKLYYYYDGEKEFGKFKVDVERSNQPYKLRLSKEGYETLEQTLDLSKLSKREYEMVLPPIFLTPEAKNKTTDLDEVTIKATKIKFYHKGDTIVYNADAFMLPEGSTLDGLIAQLPGVEIREGGKIYVNGKYVESLLLNGKDFFKGNQDAMRKNIGAYTVKNIAVYDKYGSVSNLMGQNLEDDKEYVMDVRLKKDYMGGFLGNAEAGYGTHGRYSGRLFALHFNNNARFSVYANINNVNNVSRPNERDVDMYSEQLKGISEMSNGGFDYYVEDPLKVWKINGNIDFNYSNHKNSTNTFTETFLQNGNTYQSSFSNYRNKSLRLFTYHGFEYTKPMYYIKIQPRFTYNRTRSESVSSAVNFSSDIQSRYDVDMALIDAIYVGTPMEVKEAIVNRNRFIQRNRSNNYRGYLWSEQGIKFPGMPDALNIWVEGEYNRNHTDGSSDQLIDYGFDGKNSPKLSTAYRRDNVRHPEYAGFIKGAARYWINARNYSLNFGYEYRHEQERTTSLQMFIEERAENEEAVLPADMDLIPDLPNTNFSKRFTNIHMFKTKLDYRLENDKIRLNLSVSPQFHINHRHLYYNAYDEGENGIAPVMIPVSKTAYSFHDTYVGLWLRSADNGKHQLNFRYSFDTKYVSLTNLVDLPNTTDPLNISHGNPNLKDGYINRFYLSGSTSPATDTNITLFSSLNLYNNDIVRGYTYDSQTGVRDYMAQNVNGNLYLFTFIQASKSFGPENHRFYAKASVNYDFNKYVNLIGEDGPLEKQKVYNNQLGLSASVKYTLFKNYDLTAGVFTRDSYTRSGSDLRGNTKTRLIVPNMSLNIKLPYNISIHSDMYYRIYSGSSNKDMNFKQCTLNANVQYQLNSHWGFRIQGYDLLNQSSSLETTFSASGRTQVINLTLPRFVLFCVTYKFNSKPKQ